ncbi:BTAD domain-containing putative transcriptional regulator [Streptomyces sp. AM6-12]|uniref:AfsR/SARP family transcriptional regulator n=1 Tax=Streptomyces sp. AM6-12 TaxID=3345149 RepID=UPI00379BC31D
MKTGTSAPDSASPAPGTGRPRFLVLGLLAITDGQDTVVLQPSRPASLLAALLLHPGAVVGSELLQRVVWGNRPPAGGRSALHTCVLRLRRLFAKYGVADHAIEAVPGGYRLHADAGTLDLLHFRELLARSYAADDPESALRLARAALALWGEPLLTNVHSDEIHRDLVPRLAEERLLAVERVFDGELRLGRHRELIPEAREAVRAHPGHEGLSALLVEALYRSGRRAEALAEYRRIHAHLTEELGVEPGPVLRALQLAVLRGELPEGRSGSLAQGAPAASLPSGARPLPLPLPVGSGGFGGSGEADGYGGFGGSGGLGGFDGLGRPGRASGSGGLGEPALSDGSGEPSSALGRGSPDAPGAPGALVLSSLVDAGLLQEDPSGRYRVHDLLRLFVQAAGASLPGAPAVLHDPVDLPDSAAGRTSP